MEPIKCNKSMKYNKNNGFVILLLVACRSQSFQIVEGTYLMSSLKKSAKEGGKKSKLSKSLKVSNASKSPKTRVLKSAKKGDKESNLLKSGKASKSFKAPKYNGVLALQVSQRIKNPNCSSQAKLPNRLRHLKWPN